VIDGTYQLESGYDFLYAYDGDGTSGALLASYTGSGTLHLENPNPGRPITVRMTSDVSITYSGFDLQISCVEYLPVELLYFHADCAGHATVLKWSTASETNCDRFELLASDDGAVYRKIWETPGAGSSNTETEYSYACPDCAGQKYYTLLQVDFDGNAEEYGPTFADCGEQQAYAISPNPSRDGSFEVIGSEQGDAVSIIDVAGKRASQPLPRGAYAVLVNGKYVGKLIVE
jgi:hypothetical protein